MAVDDKGGISKDNSMPWPRNSNDLKWFKKHTINQVVIMGRNTWEDPFMPTPLISRVNIFVQTGPENSCLIKMCPVLYVGLALAIFT